MIAQDPLYCMGNREAKKMSRGQPHSRTQSGRSVLERCKQKNKVNDVVCIDVDDSESNDFISVDGPESSRQNLQGSRILAQEKNSSSSSVISIDDDGSSDDETPRDHDREGHILENDIRNPSRRVSPLASGQSKNAEESDSDECQLIQEKSFPLNLSKCKRTYSGTTLPRNRFDSSSDSESSSSDSDSSDCEVMEGSSGKIREQWERAASKKRVFADVHDGHSGLQDHVGASESSSDTPEDVQMETRVKHNARGRFGLNNVNDEEDNLSTGTTTGAGITPENTPEQDEPACSGSNCKNDEKQNISTSSTTGAGITDPFLDPMESDFISNLVESIYKNTPSWLKKDSWGRAEFLSKKVGAKHGGETLWGEPSASDTELQRDVNIEGGSDPIDMDEIHVAPCSRSSHKQDDKQSLSENSQSRQKSDLDHNKTTFQNEATSVKYMDETEVHYGKVFSRDKDEGIRQQSSCGNIHLPNHTNYRDNVFKYRETPASAELPVCNSQPFGMSQVNDGAACSAEKDTLVPGDLSNAQRDEPTIIHKKVSLMDELDSSLSTHERGDIHEMQNDIIGGREKFKETDEYKRAVEEEWAARQRQLQMQAEEAQRLRKRKRAETMRLLDMEKRQKQRLEEIRETQKKDVETLNLKEQIRAEVRKELDKVESKYFDMASLLRNLGINVGGGLNPMPREVHIAYKKALLSFHPDRASRSDIRQQVEAEEKFKLISRLKEKLLPVS